MQPYMKYLNMYLERFYAKKPVIQSREKQDIKLFIDPTYKETMEIVNKTDAKGIRGGIDRSGKLYIWKIDVLRRNIEKQFNLDFIAEVTWTPMKKQMADVLFVDPDVRLKDWKDKMGEIDDVIVDAFPSVTSYMVRSLGGGSYTRKV